MVNIACFILCDFHYNKKKTLKNSKRGWVSTQWGKKKELSNFVLLLKGLFGYFETLATPHEL